MNDLRFPSGRSKKEAVAYYVNSKMCKDFSMSPKTVPQGKPRQSNDFIKYQVIKKISVAVLNFIGAFKFLSETFSFKYADYLVIISWNSNEFINSGIDVLLRTLVSDKYTHSAYVLWTWKIAFTFVRDST